MCLAANSRKRPSRIVCHIKKRLFLSSIKVLNKRQGTPSASHVGGSVIPQISRDQRGSD